MISFTSTDEREFILLAGQTTGQIFLFDPSTAEVRVVASGLDEPSGMAFDSFQDALLIAERSGVTSISRPAIESVLMQALTTGEKQPPRAQLADLFPATDVGGLAINRCSGNVFFSNRETGQILVYDPRSGEVEVVIDNLRRPERPGGYLPGGRQLSGFLPDTGG